MGYVQRMVNRIRRPALAVCALLGFSAWCSHHVTSPCECGEPLTLNSAAKDLFGKPEEAPFDPLGIKQPHNHARVKAFAVFLAAVLLVIALQESDYSSVLVERRENGKCFRRLTPICARNKQQGSPFRAGLNPQVALSLNSMVALNIPTSSDRQGTIATSRPPVWVQIRCIRESEDSPEWDLFLINRDGARRSIEIARSEMYVSKYTCKGRLTEPTSYGILLADYFIQESPCSDKSLYSEISKGRTRNFGIFSNVIIDSKF
ncbi:hypothetical protein Dimus_037414 [Dionaea muscipula]